jgi:hypothetical protein
VKDVPGIIEGQSAVLDFICETLGKKVDELATLFREASVRNGLMTETIPIDLSSRDSSIPIGLIKRSASVEETCDGNRQTNRIYAAPRLGLNLQRMVNSLKSDAYIMYFARPFRFSPCPGYLRDGKVLYALQAQIEEIPDGRIKEDLRINGDLLGRWKGIYLKGELMALDRFLTKDHSNLKDLTNMIYAFGYFRQFIM